MTDLLDLPTLRVFRYVRDYIRENSIPPSQREIAKATFMATTTIRSRPRSKRGLLREG